MGSGHSFVPLCATDGDLISLDDLQGVLSIDRQNRTAEVWAGTKIYQLGIPLSAQGLAMRNLGDIDRQSLAGAISTGTHGTGRSLASLSTQVRRLQLIDGSGELRTIDGDSLQAAALSLGALGVMTRVTLDLVPAYLLRQRTWVEGFDECMSRLDERIEQHRHFEYFYTAAKDRCLCKSLDVVVDRPVQLEEVRNADGSRSRVGPSHRILPSLRSFKFQEIEFSVPEGAGQECMKELRRLLRERFTEVAWPIEYRTQAADNLWLSPAFDRQVVTLSAHQGAGLAFEAFFSQVERICLDHGGRPHWGKWHTRDRGFFESRLPGWSQFREQRLRLDPEGRFSNPYLQHVLG